AAAAKRARQGAHLAAAVGCQPYVVREKRLEPSEVALLDRLKEPTCQLVALLARRLEGGPALPDVAPRPRRELTDVVLALADDLGDLRVVVVEHVVQQQHGALLGGEALSSSTSIASDNESAISACRAGSSWPSVMIRS